MLISFQSDENVTFRGFQATVSFIPETGKPTAASASWVPIPIVVMWWERAASAAQRGCKGFSVFAAARFYKVAVSTKSVTAEPRLGAEVRAQAPGSPWFYGCFCARSPSPLYVVDHSLSSQPVPIQLAPEQSLCTTRVFPARHIPASLRLPTPGGTCALRYVQGHFKPQKHQQKAQKGKKPHGKDTCLQYKS